MRNKRITKGLVLSVLILFGALSIMATGGGGDSSSSTGSCPEGYFSCGDPQGGPECCPTGDNCCFGYNVCCDQNLPHLGRRFSDNAQRCYRTLQDEGVTWALLTVCGVPVKSSATEVNEDVAPSCASNNTAYGETKDVR